jgi:integrase
LALTDAAVRAAKPQAKKRKLSDAMGLHLLVLPNGAKSWKLAYRYDGRQKELTLGVYPLVGLADARSATIAARQRLAEGEDPALLKRLAKMAAATAQKDTFEAIAEEWLERLAAEDVLGQRTIDKKRWLLRLAYPAIGTRPISRISPLELLDLLRRIEKSGRLETAVRARATMSQVFRFAITTARASGDPTLHLRGATLTPKVRHMAAIIQPKALGGLMLAIERYEGRPQTRTALQLVARTFVRSEELRFATRDEFDLAGALWTIPGERMKMGLRHLVPLSTQTVALLREHFAGLLGALVFPSAWDLKKPFSENTVNMALRRMGFAKADMTGHGFRRTASTLLNEQGWNPDWIERQLAHVEGNKVRSAYNAAEWLPDRTRMMQHWSDYLDRLAVEAAADDEDLIG